MSTLRHVRPGLLAAALLLLPAGLVAAPAAQAADACAGPGDVTVVVDYKDLDRDAQVLCAPDAGGTTVLETLKAAGLQTEGTTQEGDTALCRVEGLPTPEQEDCRTYSTKAYWSISIATPGMDTWAYAQLGVTEQKVEGGGFLGLSYEPIKSDFDGSAAPSLAPTQATRAQAEDAATSAGSAAGTDAGDGGDGSASDSDDGSDTGTVVTIVAGVLVALALVVALVLALRRRRHDV